jgi:hypothetical protein
MKCLQAKEEAWGLAFRIPPIEGIPTSKQTATERGEESTETDEKTLEDLNDT